MCKRNSKIPGPSAKDGDLRLSNANLNRLPAMSGVGL